MKERIEAEIERLEKRIRLYQQANLGVLTIANMEFQVFLKSLVEEDNG